MGDRIGGGGQGVSFAQRHRETGDPARLSAQDWWRRTESKFSQRHGEAGDPARLSAQDWWKPGDRE
jgi:hypothetical protein